MNRAGKKRPLKGFMKGLLTGKSYQDRWPRLLVILFMMMLLSSCALFSSLKEPRMELKAVDIKSFNLQESQFLLHFEIDNPNSQMIPLDEIEYALDLNGQPFTQGQFKDRIELKPQSMTSVAVPVRIKTHDLIDTVGRYLKDRKVHYKMKGKIKSGLLNLPIVRDGWVEMKP
jgi:LEA14-like dessication related protein